MYKVYHHPLCPFSRKLRIVLLEKGIAAQLHTERPWERRPEYLALNPFGTTPALQYKQGKVLASNYALFEFLEEAYPQLNLLGQSNEMRGITRSVTDWFDNKFYNEVSRYLIAEKIIKVLTHGGAPNSEAIRAAKNNILYHIDYLDYLLQAHRYLVDDRVTLADFAAAAQLSVLDYIGDIPWQRKKRVKEWYALIKSRPSFRPLLMDSVPPLTPPPHYANPDF
ncbi:MAG: glutathione S-transferase family protein [Proteobacteria bacterium]|nr:glutathione S-transferase family protein [Pseudomonadota bacterium]